MDRQNFPITLVDRIQNLTYLNCSAAQSDKFGAGLSPGYRDQGVR